MIHYVQEMLNIPPILFSDTNLRGPAGLDFVVHQPVFPGSLLSLGISHLENKAEET